MSEIKFNPQQQPKSKPYLECWIPRPRHKLLQKDFAAVEPTILAQVSGCPTYRKLYGPEANPNQDVYLHVGSKFRVFKDQVLKFYNPDNPTRESTSIAKKELKYLRGSILKEGHLSMMYGAGPATVHGGLTRKDIEIEFETVQEMYNDYWSPELFAVVRDYERKLQSEWRRNGGWIVNATGRPIAISPDKYKDILNTNIQSSAHDLLQRLIKLIDEERHKRKLVMFPWLVDLHDETIWEVHESAVEEGADILRGSLARLNDELGWAIKIKGDPQVAMSLADIKCES